MIRSNLLQQEEESPLLAQQPTELPEYAEPSPDSNVLVDVLQAPFKGVGNAVKNTAELAYDFADYVTGDNLKNWDPVLYKSDTLAGSMVQGISNFLTGFIPVFGQLGKVKTIARAGKFIQGTVAGAITDFAVFDAQEGNLSTLIQSSPTLANPITELLATSEEDSEAVGRLKNVVEGMGMGALTEGLIGAVRGIRRGRAARAEGKTPAEVTDLMVKEFENVEAVEDVLPKHKTPKAEVLKSKSPDKSFEDRLPELMKGSKANLDAINTPEDAGALIDAATRQRLEKGQTKTMEQIFNESASTLKEVYGKDFDEVFTYFKAQTGNTEEALTRITILKEIVGEQSVKALEAIKKAVGGDNTSKATALREAEKLSAFANLHIAAGKLQARAFGARRFLEKELLQSREAVKDFLENIGSEKYVSAELNKWAAMEPNQLAKQMGAQATFGGRLLRAHNEYWINSILSGPQTFMVNGLSNNFTSIFLPAERALGGLVTGNMGVVRSSLMQYGFALNSASESLRMAFKALKTDTPILRGPYGGGLSRSDVIQNNAISSSNLGIKADSTKGRLTDFLGKVVNMPTRMLMSTDEFFQQINYRSAAQMKLYNDALEKGLNHADAAKAAVEGVQRTITQSGEVLSEAAVYRSAIQDASEKGLTGKKRIDHIEAYVAKNWNPEDSALAEMVDIAEYAKDQAAEATFTRDLEPGTIGHSIQQFVKKHPMTQLAVPFVRTPVNLLKFVGQRTFPLTSFGKNLHTPALMKIHKRAMQDMASGDAVRISEARGRMLTGAAIMSSASALALNGKITGGGPPSEQERTLLMETGWRPYSFKFGDEYVSYQRFDPFSTLFGVIADYSYTSNRQDDITQGPLSTLRASIITSLTQNVTNKSYLAGIAKVVEVLNQPERFGESTFRKHVSSYIPNLLGQAVVGLGKDESMREIRTLTDALLGKIPGATYALEPRRNILGKVVERQLHTTPWLDNVEDWVNPAVISHDKKDKVFEELVDLQHGFTQPQPVLQGRINMLEYKNAKGQSSYDRWLENLGEVTIGGVTVHEALRNTVTSKSYRRLASKSDLATAGIDGVQTDRVGRINKILTRYRKVALRKTYKEFPDLNNEVQKTLKLKRAVRSGEASQQLQALIEN